MTRRPGWLALPLLLGGCGDELTVQLQNLWPEVDSVFVYGVRGTTTGEGVQIPVRTGLNLFDKLRLHLPQPRSAYADLTVPLRLHFDAQAADGCVIGTADKTFDPGAALPADLQMPVVRVTKGCRVTVRSRGQAGAVRAEPAAQEVSAPVCGPLCYLRLPFDQDAALVAEAGPGAHFAGFGGGCSGRAPRCAVPRLRAPLEVNAQFDAGLCTSSGALCWENPLPQGHRLSAVTGVAEDGDQTLYAVGENATLLRRGPDGWRAYTGAAIASARGRALLGVSAAGPQQVWAVGDAGAALRLEGAAWKGYDLLDQPNLTGVAAFADTTWVVGQKSAIWRRLEGQLWSRYDAQNGNVETRFTRIAGPDARGVFLVGERESLGRYRSGMDDILTRGQACGGLATLNDLFVSPLGVFAVGTGGAVQRYDSNGGCAAAQDKNPSMVDLFGLAGTADEPRFAVGRAGTLRRREGGTWVDGPKVTDQDLYAVFAGPRSAGVRYAAVGARGEILLSDGDNWARDPLAGPAPVRATLRAVAALAPDAIWAVGDGGVILRYDGAAWRREESPDQTGNALLAIWASSAGVFAAGDAGILLQRGSDGRWSFLKPPVDQTLSAVAAVGSLLFVGTSAGTVACRQPNGSWLTSSLGALPINALYVGGGQLWAAGPRQRPTSSHLFSQEAVDRCLAGMIAVPTGREDLTLYGLFGRSPDDLWAVGERVILHRVGTAWTAEDRSETLRGGADLRTAGGAVYAAGSSGALLRRAADSPFQPLDGGTRTTVYGAAGVGPDNLILVGETGAVLRLAP